MGFDALSSAGARAGGANRSVKATGARFGWGVDNPNDVKQFAPKMELLAEQSKSQMPDWRRLPTALQVLVQVMELFPKLRRMNRDLVISLLRYTAVGLYGSVSQLAFLMDQDR